MLLSLQNAGKSYGAERVLEKVNLTIEDRSRIALIGPNGAGKTTLLNLITGKAKDKKISVLMYVLAILFILKYIFL